MDKGIKLKWYERNQNLEVSNETRSVLCCIGLLDDINETITHIFPTMSDEQLQQLMEASNGYVDIVLDLLKDNIRENISILTSKTF